jgi:hypothetical protein
MEVRCWAITIFKLPRSFPVFTSGYLPVHHETRDLPVVRRAIPRSVLQLKNYCLKKKKKHQRETRTAMKKKRKNRENTLL